MAIKRNNVNDRRVKHGKPISGVRRNYVYNGVTCFVIYGKTRIQARYGAFGIVDGEVMQVKRLADAIIFRKFDIDNAKKFAKLCEKIYPDYDFEIREHVRIYRNW